MAIGKIRLTVHPKAEPIWNQQSEIVSVREEDNSHDITFSYQHMDAASISSMQVLYQEGIPNDPSQTYIVIASQQTQYINQNSAGSIVLHIVSNGVSDQLDKVVNFNIGPNPVSLSINFESRPDTSDILKSTPNYTVPIQITQQDILNAYDDFDGNPIVKFAIDCGPSTNLMYNGSPYVSMQYIPVNNLDTVGLFYHPDNNGLGYVQQYDWYAEDSTGLRTKM